MLILVGHSASGKTEIANQLKRDYDMKKIITYTTRPKRINEIDGVDYHFVDEDKFLKLKEENFFVETTNFNGYYYGSSKNDVKDDAVVILDPQGLEKFKNSNLDNIIAIFLNCDEEIRYKRMINRGDNENIAKERLEHDRIKFSYENLITIDEFINTSVFSINYLSDLVYKTYKDLLKKQKEDKYVI